jgi:hypothetical protein
MDNQRRDRREDDRMQIPDGWELVRWRNLVHGTVLIFTNTQRPESRLNKVVALSETYEDALAEAQRRMQLYDDVQGHHRRQRRQRSGWNA